MDRVSNNHIVGDIRSEVRNAFRTLPKIDQNQKTPNLTKRSATISNSGVPKKHPKLQFTNTVENDVFWSKPWGVKHKRNIKTSTFQSCHSSTEINEFWSRRCSVKQQTKIKTSTTQIGHSSSDINKFSSRRSEVSQQGKELTQLHRISDSPVETQSTTPIIIVPASSASLITRLNAKNILENLKFVSTYDKESKSYRKLDQIMIKSRIDEKSIQITDSPLKLSSEDWNRVVAIFISSTSLWQFVGWPWNGNPTVICSNIPTFYLQWKSKEIPLPICNWSVTTIFLDKHKRHEDRAALLYFWHSLEKRIKYKKPKLL